MSYLPYLKRYRAKKQVYFVWKWMYKTVQICISQMLNNKIPFSIIFPKYEFFYFCTFWWCHQKVTFFFKLFYNINEGNVRSLRSTAELKILGKMIYVVTFGVKKWLSDFSVAMVTRVQLKGLQLAVIVFPTFSKDIWIKNRWDS